MYVSVLDFCFMVVVVKIIILIDTPHFVHMILFFQILNWRT